MLHDGGSTAALSKWPHLFCGLVEGALDIDGSGDECGVNLSSALHRGRGQTAAEIKRRRSHKQTPSTYFPYLHQPLGLLGLFAEGDTAIYHP